MIAFLVVATLGLYASDKLRVTPNLTIALGLRFDERNLTDDEHVSPRFNLAWKLAETTTLRAAWGIDYQSHRLHDSHCLHDFRVGGR